jgi:hypothetical protein
VTFKDAVEGIPSIRDAFRPGIAALRRPDRTRVTVGTPRLLTGSIDLDLALKHVFPNDSRWDYGIGHKPKRDSEWIHWIEVHAATSSTHIVEMNEKLSWLKNWLTGQGRRLNGFKRQFIWISSGRNEFTAISPQRRRISENGLISSGGHFRIK